MTLSSLRGTHCSHRATYINEPCLQHRFRALRTRAVNASWRAVSWGGSDGGIRRPLGQKGQRRPPGRADRCRGCPAAAPSGGQGLSSPRRHWVGVTGRSLFARARGRLPGAFRSSLRKLRLSHGAAGPAAAASAPRERGVLPPAACSAGWVSISQAPLCPSEGNCESPGRCLQNMSNWTSLWYIWLILLTLFLFLLCGITASCIKFCCRKKRLPVETFSRHPYDLTVIAIDSDSTAHSTVTSYSSWQYPLSAPIPSVFVDMDKNTVPLPAYSLCAMELPPSYDEAVQMGKQHIEVPRISQKCNDIPGQVTSGGMNPIQYSPGTSNRYPATQANSGNSEDATQEQLQLCDSFQMGSKGRGE